MCHMVFQTALCCLMFSGSFHQHQHCSFHCHHHKHHHHDYHQHHEQQSYHDHHHHHHRDKHQHNHHRHQHCSSHHHQAGNTSSMTMLTRFTGEEPSAAALYKELTPVIFPDLVATKVRFLISLLPRWVRIMNDDSNHLP